MPDNVDSLRGDLRIRKSARSKRLRLVASAEKGVELVLPKGFVSKRTIERFLREHEAWIERHAVRIEKNRNLLKQESKLRTGSKLFLKGEPVRLVAERTERARSSVRYDEQKAALAVSVGLKGDPCVALRNWYVREARNVLERDVSELAPKQDVRVRRVAVRNQKTIWGSCSSNGTISLNWRLVLLPPRVRRYVVHHELAHVVWKNHGKRFWARVEKHDPNMKEHKRWLRTEGQRHMRFLRENATISVHEGKTVHNVAFPS